MNQWERAQGVGELDPTFGIGGTQTIDFTYLWNVVYGFYPQGTTDDMATGVDVQPDGSILVVGTLSVDGQLQTDGAGTILTAGGEVEYQDLFFSGFSNPTAVQADGKTLVVGRAPPPYSGTTPTVLWTHRSATADLRDSALYLLAWRCSPTARLSWPAIPTSRLRGGPTSRWPAWRGTIRRQRPQRLPPRRARPCPASP